MNRSKSIKSETLIQRWRWAGSRCASHLSRFHSWRLRPVSQTLCNKNFNLVFFSANAAANSSTQISWRWTLWSRVIRKRSMRFVTISRIKRANAPAASISTARGMFYFELNFLTISLDSEEEQTYISKNLLSLKYKCQYELGIYNLQSTFKLPDSRKGSFSKCTWILT